LTTARGYNNARDKYYTDLVGARQSEKAASTTTDLTSWAKNLASEWAKQPKPSSQTPVAQAPVTPATPNPTVATTPATPNPTVAATAPAPATKPPGTAMPTQPYQAPVSGPVVPQAAPASAPAVAQQAVQQTARQSMADKVRQLAAQRIIPVMGQASEMAGQALSKAAPLLRGANIAGSADRSQ
jgi:hypothetical protein